MRNVAALVAASLLCFAGFVGCATEPEPEEDMLSDLGEVEQELAGDCTVSLECSTGVTVSCSGTSYQCSVGTSGVTCNGSLVACPSTPGAPCYFKGKWYQDGYVFGAAGTGIRCSSKVNGYCTAGPFAGNVCVANGECYATCVDGTWEN